MQTLLLDNEDQVQDYTLEGSNFVYVNSSQDPERWRHGRRTCLQQQVQLEEVAY